jgi:hypothetical protein
MVEASSHNANYLKEDTYCNESYDALSPEMAYAMNEISSAVLSRIDVGNDNLSLKRSTTRFSNDQAFAEKFQRELELLQQSIYEKGYQPSAEVLK